MIVIAERLKTHSNVMRAAPRPCNRFENHVGLEVLPVSAFSWGDGSTGRGTRRRRLATCNECRARELEEKEQRRREREERAATFLDPETFMQMRRCSKCLAVKELVVDYYVEHKRADGTIAKWSYVCKTCSVERTTALHRQRLRDPSTADQERAQREQWRRQWRDRNRERYRETQRRYKERVRADPVRYARSLETARIAYRLRAERREGREVKAQPVRVPAPEPKLPRLPAEPLLHAVEGYLHDADGILSYADLGVDERSVRRWREALDAGRTPYVQFRAADRTLLAIQRNVWDVWPEDQFPEIHERLRKVFGEEE